MEEALRGSRDLVTDLTEQVPGVVYQYRLYPDGRSASRTRVRAWSTSTK